MLYIADDSPQMSNPWRISCNDRIGPDSYNDQMPGMSKHSTHIQQNQQLPPPQPPQQSLDYNHHPQHPPTRSSHPATQQAMPSMVQNSNSSYYQSNFEAFPNAPPGLGSQFRNGTTNTQNQSQSLRNSSHSSLHNAPPRSMINGAYEVTRNEISAQLGFYFHV